MSLGLELLSRLVTKIDTDIIHCVILTVLTPHLCAIWKYLDKTDQPEVFFLRSFDFWAQFI